MTLFTKDWKDELSGKKNPNANCIHSSSLLRGGERLLLMHSSGSTFSPLLKKPKGQSHHSNQI